MLIVTLASYFAPITTHAATQAAVQYRYKDGSDDQNRKNRIGIRSVVIDDKTYYDIYDGKTDGRVDPTNQLLFLKAVLQNGTDKTGGTDSVINQWSTLAEQIFGTHSSFSAEVNAGGGFSENFINRNGDGGYADISDALSKADSGSWGKKGKDYTYWTGLAYAKNLSSIRTESADRIAKAINRKVKADDILGSLEDKDKDKVLGALNDDAQQDVLYSLVTCVDRSGSTAKFTYNTFGIAFYDFQLTALAGDGLEYITGAQAYDSIEEAAFKNPQQVSYTSTGRDNPVISYYKNDSKEEADVGMEFTQSHSVTTSNTLETGSSYSFSEMVGSETKLGAGFFGLADVEQSLTLEVTCEQAMSTAWSETKEYSTSTENTVSSSMTLPAQTAVGMESSNATTNIDMTYNCPVAITYKTAIFSLSGDVYDDNAATKSFHTAGYTQKDFCTVFGAESPKGGVTATDNLCYRAIKYKDIQNYEQSYGQVDGYSKTKGKSAKTLNALNWDGILGGTISEEALTPEKASVTVKCFEVTETTDNNTNTTTLTVSKDPFDTWNVSDLTVGYESFVKTNSSIKTGDGDNQTSYTIYTGKVEVNGEDLNEDLEKASDGTYHKLVQPFSQEEIDGLNLTDANTVYFYYTKDASDDSGSDTGSTSNASASIAANAAAASGGVSVRAASSASDIQNIVTKLSSSCPMSVTGGSLSYDATSMNSNINDIVALYPLASVSVTNGIKSLNMISGDTFNTDNIELTGKNKNNVAYYGFDSDRGHWELCDEDGNPLGEEAQKIASMKTDNKTGESKVVAGTSGSVYLKYVIDEGCYTSMEKSTPTKNSEITTAMVKVNVTEKPFDGKVEASGTATFYVGEESVSLYGHETIKGYAIDSTDKKITGAPIEWQSRLDEEDGIKLEGNNLSFTKPGEYQIRATYHGQYSDWITVEALPARKLDKITISDETEPKTLEPFIFGDKTTPAVIDLSKLKVESVDQYNANWDMKNPAWVVKVDGEAIAGALVGNTLKIEKAGTYTIQLKCDDVLSNVLSLDVKEARKLNSVSIESEALENGLGIGDAYAYDLDKVTVTAKDQYGADFDWNSESYEWVTGGKYSKVSQGKLTGLVGGSDTLKLIVGEGDSKLESNTIDFKVLLKPYVAELYGAKNTIEEGERFLLKDVKFNAKDQNGETYTLSEAEIMSIDWLMTDKGTIKGDAVEFNPTEKFVSVKKGTLKYGETGSVILMAEYKNPGGQTSKATQVVIDVRQKPILDALTLEQKDSSQVLKNGENAYNSDFFTVKGTDQYGNDYALDDDTDFIWTSDNKEAFVFDDSNALIQAVNPGTSAKVTVTAKNSIDKDVTSNELELSVPRVKKLSSITMEGAPEVLALGTDFDMNTLKVTCYDELKQAYEADELEAYPAEIRFTLDNGKTDTRLDTATNKLTTGDKYGYITVSAMAVNSSTTNEITNDAGDKIIDSIKIWVGPKVEKISAETKMNADAGNNTIELTGQCLQDNMKVGLFDANGNRITEGKTVGSESKQTAELEVPENIGGDSDVTYTVKYAITDEYMDSPTENITVSNKIPAVSVELNTTKMVIEPGKTKTLKATINPENSTDSITWKSSKSSVAAVDKNGIIKAASPGTAVITVETESGATAKCNVTVGLRKGDTFAKGIYRYEVTNSKVDGKGTARVIGFVKGKNAKSVEIVGTSSWNGISYKVTSVGKKAFYRNNKIQNVTIGNNVKTIYNGAFRECKNIENCTISSSVESIRSYAFYKCYDLKKLSIGKNVKSIGKHAFCNDNNLAKIVFKGKSMPKLNYPHVFIHVDKAKVYVPKATYKAYKKMLSNYGLAKCEFKKF